MKFEPTANPKDYYDCVWVLKRQPHYDYINVKLISFKGSLGRYVSRDNDSTTTSTSSSLVLRDL